MAKIGNIVRKQNVRPRSNNVSDLIKHFLVAVKLGSICVRDNISTLPTIDWPFFRCVARKPRYVEIDSGRYFVLESK